MMRLARPKSRQIGFSFLLFMALMPFFAGCGAEVSPSPRSELSQSSDDQNAESNDQSLPEMSVEDVVFGFENFESLLDQTASPEEQASREASLVMGDRLKPADYEESAADFSLGDEIVVDQREIVDLRVNDTGVRNQGSEGTCTAFATVATMENLIKRFYGKTVDLSERHHWTTYADYQSTTSLKRASSAPIVSEAAWPYRGSKPSSVSGLGLAKLDSYATTKLSLQPIVENLRQGKPVVIAVGVLTSLMNPKQGGIVTGGTLKRGAGHAIALTGAIIDSRVPGGGYFIIKNSWGTNWGDKGYGYVAFDYCQRAWCSAYSIADVSLYADGQILPKPDGNGNIPDQPTPTPANPVPEKPELSASDFNLVGHPSNRRGIFGMTSYYLTLNAKPEHLREVKSIQYVDGSGRGYTIVNGAAADVNVSSKNLASPDFRTRARRVETGVSVIKLRSGQVLKVNGVKIQL
jgi:C1A family cysteine protease